YRIIFATGFDQYAIKAIKYAAFDYLLKPINLEALRETIERIKETNEVDSLKQNIPLLMDYLLPQKIQLKTKSESIFINPLDIVYIDADGSYSEIYLDSGDRHVVSYHLAKIKEMLPQKHFIRISRSIIINRNLLKRFNKKKRILHLENEGITYDFQVSFRYMKHISLL
ncbi:MAG: LytTR family transcriptional regulator DNA-binding domain-containing protein, partial [Bacteroidia bacterium]|nr:LytTR family transcriptional regulator DNA-binding domain-containing protein [Bacteroidia bacterium]